METYVCKQCGKEFKPKAKDRITFCSRECAFDFKHDHIKPKIKPEPKKIECVCVICGKRFENNRRCKLCSNECRKELARRKTYKHNYESKALKPHRCKECGLEFIPEYGNKRRSFCSDECMHRSQKRDYHVKARVKNKDLYISHINFDDICKRDKCICQICGVSIDMSLKASHPMSVTVDHIMPLSKGGTHEIDNVQLAHRICNIMKSDKTA